MKSFFRPSNILFYFLSAIVFFFVGLFFAALTGAGKGQGLAGGAIVFFYGIVAAGIALVVAIIAVRYLEASRVILFNKILGVLLLLFTVFSIYRFISMEKRPDKPENALPRKTTVPAVPAIAISHTPALQRQSYQPPMGLGMLVPGFYDFNVIYFYGNLNLKKPVSEHAPTDSLVFKRSERGVEIAYAPPWFVPAHLKLDYDVLFIRIVSVHSDFIEIVVNKTNGQRAYVDRDKSKIKYWPEFLLTINSVEPLYPQNNPVRVKPLSHAGLVSTPYSFLKPLKISNQWMQVELLGDGFKSLGQGWIRWQENGKMLITYSLFS